MSYVVNKRQIDTVLTDIAVVLSTTGAPKIEAMLALVEMAGRIVVDASEGPTHGQQLYKAAAEHLERSVRVGASAQGKPVLTGA